MTTSWLGPWIGGTQIRRTQRGQTPIADLLCSLCGHHQRVTGRQLVEGFLKSQPITTHQAQ